jgi:non-ribosomal peptide synthetase component E (peptide arylation enzyme)
MFLHPRQHAERDPTKPALILTDRDERISYGELVANADRCAQVFAALGLAQGDTIAILLENHIRYAEICWAAKNSSRTPPISSRTAMQSCSSARRRWPESRFPSPSVSAPGCRA